MVRAYEEIVDFIAGGSTPDEVIAFEVSAKARGRVSDLIRRDREGSLTSEETSELAHTLHCEHLMRLAKARARLQLG